LSLKHKPMMRPTLAG